MKTTLIALAAASMISLGTAATASAAPNAGLDITAGNAASVQKVGHRGGVRIRIYRHGYGYRYYGYGYGYRHFCKKLYYKGWVLGYAWARHKFYSYCGYKPYYGY